MAKKDDAHIISEFKKERAEALTDGIFATVMTILVLSLVVPVITSGNIDTVLTSDLFGLLPNILTYAMSFLVLGTLWIGHNNIFRYLEKAERHVQWINLIFLLSVGFIPFTTAILGRYPLDHISLLVYGINLLAVAIIYNVFWAYALRQKFAHMELEIGFIKSSLKRSSVGILIYVVGIFFSSSHPKISLGLYVMMPVYYMVVGILSRRVNREWR